MKIFIVNTRLNASGSTISCGFSKISEGGVRPFKSLVLGLVLICNSAYCLHVWKGYTSSDWNVGSNWDMGTFPNENVDVEIGTPDGTYRPEITNTNRKCRNLTFVDDGYIDFNLNSSTLNVYGDIDNQSSATYIFDTKGIVNIIDDTSPYDSQCGGNEIYFNRLTINKTNSGYQFDMTCSVFITEFLRVTTGIVNIGADLTLLDGWNISSDWRTAYIDGSGDCVVNGSHLIVQQHVYESYESWHFMCSPVSDYGTTTSQTNQLHNNTNNQTYDDTYCFPASTIPDYLWYKENMAAPSYPMASSNMYGWCGLDDSPYRDFERMEGYVVKFDPDITTNMIDYEGEANSGTIPSPTLLYTNNSQPADDGFNLIGNPYPSPLDWNHVWDTKIDGTYATNEVSPIAYFWCSDGNPATNTNNHGYYTTWDAYNNTGSGGRTDGRMAIGQGFFIQVFIPSVSFNMENDDRTNDYDIPFTRESLPENIAQIKLSGKNNVDYLFVEWNDKYQSSFEHGTDAGKMFNFWNNMYTKSGSEFVCMNRIPSSEALVPIYIQVKEGGIYNFNYGEIIFKSAGYECIFEDRLLNKFIKLTEVFTYSAELNKGYNNDRFYFHYIRKNENSAISNLNYGRSYYSNNNIVVYSNNSMDNTGVFIYNYTGQKVYHNEAIGITQDYLISTDNFKPGPYIVQINFGSHVEYFKINIIK